MFELRSAARLLDCSILHVRMNVLAHSRARVDVIVPLVLNLSALSGICAGHHAWQLFRRARREKAREVSWEASSSVRARRRSAALSLIKCAAPHALIQFDLIVMANKDRARVSSRRI